MPIEYAPRIIDRHFGVTDEQAALAGAELGNSIKISNALRAAPKLTAPTSPPVNAQPLAEALSEAQDWRAKLGLG